MKEYQGLTAQQIEYPLNNQLNDFQYESKNINHKLKEELNNIVPKEFTVDYFKKRIPFLKNYDVITDPEVNPHPRYKDAIKLIKQSFNSNFQSKIGDEIYTFPHFNIVSEFRYSSNIIRNNVFYNFSIENHTYITQPEEMDELLYRTFLTAGNLKEKQDFSKNYEIFFPIGEQIPKSKLDEIINDINRRLFNIEEFTDSIGLSLF